MNPKMRYRGACYLSLLFFFVILLGSPIQAWGQYDFGCHYLTRLVTNLSASEDSFRLWMPLKKEKNVTPAVVAVIQDEYGRFLMAKRKNAAAGDGAWALIGGKVDPSKKAGWMEPPALSLKREGNEEIGVELDENSFELLDVDQHVLPNQFTGRDQFYRTYIVKAKIKKGKPMNNEPHKLEGLGYYHMDDKVDGEVIGENLFKPMYRYMPKVMEILE